jgi:hypothetical protein
VTEEQVATAIAAVERELAEWKLDAPPPPSGDALAAWQQAEGGAARADLPVDAGVVRSRGRAALAKLRCAPRVAQALTCHPVSNLEQAIVWACGAAALVASAVALLAPTLRVGLGMAGAAGWVVVAVIGGRFVAHQRAESVRRAAVDSVRYHTLYTEHVVALDREAGWLLALASALRAQTAFDAHEGEGGQLAQLARWRPDLEPAVVEVARTNIPAPARNAW